MIVSLGRAGGPPGFAFPVIFWKDTELSFSRMKVTGFEVPSTSHQGPMRQMSEPCSEPGTGALLSPQAPDASYGLGEPGAAAPSPVPEGQSLLLIPLGFPVPQFLLWK